jgi:hypothetical protein
MSFLNKMMDEAGKKTGKAIGNKLFGKYAADRVVEFNYNKNTNATNAAAADSSSAQELAEFQNNMQRKNELIDLVFDESNVQNNYKILFKLITIIDSEIKTGVSDNSEMYSLARSKFDAGILMCQMVDPTNPNIALFQSKQKEWDNHFTKQNKSTKQTVIITVIIALVCSGLLFYYLVEEVL